MLFRSALDRQPLPAVGRAELVQLLAAPLRQADDRRVVLEPGVVFGARGSGLVTLARYVLDGL